MWPSASPRFGFHSLGLQPLWGHSWPRHVSQPLCFGWISRVNTHLSTGRVYKIFSNSRLRTRMLLNSHLLAMYGVVLAGELLLLVIWTGYDTLIPTKIQSAASSLYVFEACRGKHERFQGGMFIAFIIYNALLLGAGSIMSYKTRKVHSSFNESKYIAYAVSFNGLCGIIDAPNSFMIFITRFTTSPFAWLSSCPFI